MNRTELEGKVFDILRVDMTLIGTPDEELWKSIKEADDNTLLTFIEEVE